MPRRPLDRAELVARLNRNVDAAAQSQHDGVIRAWAQTRAGLDLSDSALPAALIAGFWREQLALGAGGPRRRPPAAEPAPPVVLSPRTKPSTEAGQVRAWALGVGIDVDPAGPLPRMVRRLHNETVPSVPPRSQVSRAGAWTHCVNRRHRHDPRRLLDLPARLPEAREPRPQ